jgi:hypothetical protein
MKTIILTIITTLIMSFNGLFGQSISSEDIIRLPQKLFVTKSQYLDQNNTSQYYSIYFRNLQYEVINDIKSIRFENKDQLISFLNFCSKVIADENPNITHFYTKEVTITYRNFMGVGCVYIWADNPSGYTWLKERQIQKILSKL